MKRRRVLLLLGSCLCLAPVCVGSSGCGPAAWLAFWTGLYGSYRNESGNYMAVEQSTPQARQESNDLLIMYPSGGVGGDYTLNGTATQSGNTFSGSFQVTSGPAGRALGPLSVGATVTVSLTQDHDNLASSIQGTVGSALTDSWVKVHD